MTVRSVVERVRQPEYTGENRCAPCTAVNIVLAGVLGAALTLVSGTVGIVAFLGSVGAISLRGYLVPGTPTLTKRYFPDWVLARFDKLPEDPGDAAIAGAASGPATDGPATSGPTTNGHGGTSTDRGAGDAATSRPGATGTTGASDETAREAGETGDVERMDPETALQAAGAIEPCEIADDLCLASEFRAAWRDRITDLRERGVAAGDALDTLGVTERDEWVTDGNEDGSLSREEDAVTLERADGAGIVAQWESEAALLADAAGAEVLGDRLPAWEALGVEGRSRLLYALRLFVETCPECDGDVSLGGEVVTSCCRAMEVAVVTCEDCDARLFEQQ